MIVVYQDELLMETAIVFVLYIYAIYMLACHLSAYFKYDCVKATIHSKTYFGMEKDACVPTRPMNGVCLGLVFTYRSRDYTGYTQSDHDKQKVGDKVDICVEKSDPSMFTTDNKRDMLMVFFWLSLTMLLGMLASSKLSRWLNRSAHVGMMLGAVYGVGVIFITIIMLIKLLKKK